MRYFIGLAFILLAVGCQHSPSRVYETREVDLGLLAKNIEGPVKVTEKTVIVDARSTFDYSMAHVPSSVHLQWQDLKNPDLRALGRRLALKGIDRSSQVLVIGNGKQGRGEEGRVAWTLLLLGLNDVQVASIKEFKVTHPVDSNQLHPNKPIWTPELRTQILSDKAEVFKLATAKVSESGKPPGFIIDVRSRREYFAKRGLGEGYKTPELRALHVPWTEFYADDGRPNLAIREKLRGIGIDLHDRIVVISEQGVRSGAVTFSLLSLGFSKAANYDGGWNELLDQEPLKKRR